MEIWGEIPLHPTYLVSNLGRVKSLPRKHVRNERILKTPSDHYGYPVVNINKIKYKVHRLVAKVFLGDFSENMIVNHIDGDKSNNRVDNLEWTTYSGNIAHAYAKELNKGPKGSKNRHAKLSATQVRNIRNRYEFRKITMKMLAEEYDVTVSTIKYILYNKTWRHLDG